MNFIMDEYNKKKYIAQKISTYYKNKYKTKIKNKLTETAKTQQKTAYNEMGFSKIYQCIIKRMSIAFIKYGIPFKLSYREILGCSKDDLEKYIIEKLENGMTIENHGEWEVDHIIPITSFNFDDKINITTENIIKCFNHTNLQPLWKHENRSKK